MKNWEYPNPIKGKDRLIMVEKKQNKNRHFNFRVNEKEYNKIKSQIEKSKLNTSEYLLRTAMDKDIIVVDGLEEIRTSPNGHYSKTESALILRILEYKDNYFIWMYDFNLPSDDNLSERALRSTKSKMKVSGQFQNINYARYFADIKTYIETCYRNGINPTSALIALMDDKPLKLSEILANKKDEKSE